MDDFLYEELYRIERTHWWAVGMRQIFGMLLDGALPDGTRSRRLDVGCGTGIALEELGGRGCAVGLDVSAQALSYTRSRHPDALVVRGDLARLPFASASIDAVLAFDVLEHLEDDASAVGEIGRVLRPGGVALLNVPAFSSLWGGKDVAAHHRRRYTRGGLGRLIVGAGFAVERLTYTNAMLFAPIWCVRRLERLLARPWDSDAEYHPPGSLNAALLGILRLERRVPRHVDLPFGTSVTCLARKRSPDMAAFTRR